MIKLCPYKWVLGFDVLWVYGFQGDIIFNNEWIVYQRNSRSWLIILWVLFLVLINDKHSFWFSILYHHVVTLCFQEKVLNGFFCIIRLIPSWLSLCCFIWYYDVYDGYSVLVSKGLVLIWYGILCWIEVISCSLRQNWIN